MQGTIHKMVADGTIEEELAPFINLVYAIEEDSYYVSDQSHASNSSND